MGDPQLEDLERRAYRRQNEDGLWDIGIGLSLKGPAVLIQWPAHPWLPAFSLIWFAPCVPWCLRDWLRHRRLGRFKPGPGRRRQQGRVIACFAAFLILLIAGSIVFGLLGDTWSPVGALYGFAIAVAAMGAIAHLEDCPRMWIYGLPMGLALAFSFLPERDAHPAVMTCVLIASGLAAMITGAILLRRFLTRYPTPATHDGIG